MQYGPYNVEVGPTLMISAVTLLIILALLLIIVPLNKWILSRKIGWGLIALWTLSTVANVVVEVTGVWQES
jgi:sodium/potassium/calcium exchanger 6